jgi:hypothetical protein
MDKTTKGAEGSPSWYPMEALEQVVPLFSSRQYPRTPKVMEPSILSTESEALRRKMDLNHGTEKETMARRTVAIRVTMNPGVAGFIEE